MSYVFHQTKRILKEIKSLLSGTQEHTTPEGVNQRLRRFVNKIIDYATRFRSDFGDIYLNARCRFFIGNTAGISLITKDMPCHPHRSRIGAAFLRQHIHLLCD